MKKLLSSTKFQVGFTLIELLIVVVIIVIVIGVGAASYTTVARNARNTQRQADLAKIATALEEYYSDHGSYPNHRGGTYLFGTANATSMPYSDDLNCLLGGSRASGTMHQVSGSPVPTCSPPYNVYIGNGSIFNFPWDPLAPQYPVFQHLYVWASDGQSYVLATQLYEGAPPTDNAFTCSFDPFYRHEAQLWQPTLIWEKQYAVKSPNQSPPYIGICP